MQEPGERVEVEAKENGRFSIRVVEGDATALTSLMSKRLVFSRHQSSQVFFGNV